jgi:hypothetical protein
MRFIKNPLHPVYGSATQKEQSLNHLRFVPFALVNDDDIPSDRSARSHNDAVHVGATLVACLACSARLSADSGATFSVVYDVVDIFIGLAQLVIFVYAVIGEFGYPIIQIISHADGSSSDEKTNGKYGYNDNGSFQHGGSPLTI